MEYALRDKFVVEIICNKDFSLNPCFNGICSQRILSPMPHVVIPTVLILVLMEYALREDNLAAWLQDWPKVLILVLMEYALRAIKF